MAVVPESRATPAKAAPAKRGTNRRRTDGAARGGGRPGAAAAEPCDSECARGGGCYRQGLQEEAASAAPSFYRPRCTLGGAERPRAAAVWGRRALAAAT